MQMGEVFLKKMGNKHQKSSQDNGFNVCIMHYDKYFLQWCKGAKSPREDTTNGTIMKGFGLYDLLQKHNTARWVYMRH